MTTLQLFPAKHLSARMPVSRDPFINTPLLRVSPDPVTGAERFWISTYNAGMGAMGVLIDEFGNHRILRTNNSKFPGFYSAVMDPVDPDTLWLTCISNWVVKITLSTLAWESFPASANQNLVFQGMAADPVTRKLAFGAYDSPTGRITIFDTLTRKTTFDGISPSKGLYLRASFPNGDGTISLLFHLPGTHILIWDPKTDALTDVTLAQSITYKQAHFFYNPVVQNDQGDRFIHDLGWYRPSLRKIVDAGPHPEFGVTVIARHKDRYLAAKTVGQAASVGLTDPQTGKFTPTCSIPDSQMVNINLTKSGKIVAVNTYGEFFRFNADNGALECSKRLDADSNLSVYSLIRSTKTKILGTTFINQRFFEVDMETGIGSDLGRCAPGAGEAMFAKRVNGIVYMGAYTGGELTAYDPAKPARFPENPRVVADPPGAMRPIAVAHDDKILFYSSSNEYAVLGSTITRYDTSTGLASYSLNPLPDLQIHSLVLDAKPGSKNATLYAGSTIHADCESATPTQTSAAIAMFDADTLALKKRVNLPAGFINARVLGWVSSGTLLVIVQNTAGKPFQFHLDAQSLEFPDVSAFKPTTWSHPLATHIPGLFVLSRAQQIEVWDFRLPEPGPVRLLHEKDEKIRYVCVDGDEVLYTYTTQVRSIPGFLEGLK